PAPAAPPPGKTRVGGSRGGRGRAGAHRRRRRRLERRARDDPGRGGAARRLHPPASAPPGRLAGAPPEVGRPPTAPALWTAPKVMPSRARASWTSSRALKIRHLTVASVISSESAISL